MYIEIKPGLRTTPQEKSKIVLSLETDLILKVDTEFSNMRARSQILASLHDLVVRGSKHFVHGNSKLVCAKEPHGFLEELCRAHSDTSDYSTFAQSKTSNIGHVFLGSGRQEADD